MLSSINNTLRYPILNVNYFITLFSLNQSNFHTSTCTISNLLTGPRWRVPVPDRGEPVPDRGVVVLHRGKQFSIIVQCPFSVRNSGQLMPTSVIQGPGHNFAAEDPTIFLEDTNITTGEKVVRQRQFPQVFIPSTPVLGTGPVDNLSLQDIQRLHQTTGEILARSSQQQQPQPHPSASSPPVPSQSTTSPDLDMPPLEAGSKQCPVCQKKFRDFNKCRSHYNTQHKRHSQYTCKKCKKVLGTKANLLHHQDVFHKQFSFVCIYCQHSTQRKVDMSRHMKSHLRWVDYPELRCRPCGQAFHN